MGGATLGPRPEAVAERSYPASEIKGGQEEPPCARGQGQQLGGDTLHPKPGVVAGRSNLSSKERWLCGHRRAESIYSTFKVSRGSSEEIPLIQSKEQQLCFAGAVMKR